MLGDALHTQRFPLPSRVWWAVGHGHLSSHAALLLLCTGGADPASLHPPEMSCFLLDSSRDNKFLAIAMNFSAQDRFTVFDLSYFPQFFVFSSALTSICTFGGFPAFMPYIKVEITLEMNSHDLPGELPIFHDQINWRWWLWLPFAGTWLGLLLDVSIN